MLHAVQHITKVSRGSMKPLTPLPHQERVADRLQDEPGVIAYHGLGSGKTLSAINAAQKHKLPLLAIVPAALRENMKKEIARAGFTGESRVMSYQEALNRKNDPEFLDFASKSLMAVDECLPGWILVGEHTLETVPVGGKVPSVAEGLAAADAAVTARFARQTDTLVVLLAGSRVCVASHNHRILTQRGFVPAEEIGLDDTVVVGHTVVHEHSAKHTLSGFLSRVQTIVPDASRAAGDVEGVQHRDGCLLAGMPAAAVPEDASGGRRQGSGSLGSGDRALLHLFDACRASVEGAAQKQVDCLETNGTDDVQRRMLACPDGQRVGGVEPAACLGADDHAQPDGQSGHAAKDENHPSRDEMGTSATGRERDWPVRTTAATACRAGAADARLGDGDDRANRPGMPGERASDAFQGGRRESPASPGDRGGRNVTPGAVPEVSGHPEDRIFTHCRVDCVAVLQRGRDAGFEALCPGGVVYDLEVDGHGCYVAGGVVVHNSHRTVGTTEEAARRKIHDIPAMRKLLMTATPIRNRPEEVIPLVNAIQPGSLPKDPAQFRKQFIDSHETPVGFFGRLTGAKPGRTETPKNLPEFAKAVQGKVDFYGAADRSDFPSASESIVDVPMSDKQQAAYNMVMGKYPMIAYKIRHGLPPGKNEEADFKAFMSGPRQVANHPGGFHSGATDADAAKIQAAADEIDKRYRADKNYRGVGYSAFLGSGIHPLSRQLDKRGVPHAVFTGEQDEKERKKIVEDYNAGKNPVLLISGAGAEGLDLKGTKHMALLEPHWNEELMDQVKGRGIRYKSHSHLPENERHVEIQRFHAIPQPSWFDRLMGRKRSKELGSDEYIHQRAKEKRKLNQPFLDVMKGEDPEEVKEKYKLSAVEFGCVPFYQGRTAGILLDLDQTLVTGEFSPEGYITNQQVLPHRREALRRLKALGYTLLGITNRSCYRPETSPAQLFQSVEETCCLLEDLLDDVFFSIEPDKNLLKPSPAMLLTAMAKYHLDPATTLMVGDSEDDKNAAIAANVGFVYPEEFFSQDFDTAPCAAQTEPLAAFERWRIGHDGRLYGQLECNGADAVTAMQKAVAWAAEQMGEPVPETVVSDTMLEVTLPSFVAGDAELAALIDYLYDNDGEQPCEEPPPVVPLRTIQRITVANA
jgi:HAD superfamily hydrolase (TIGR01662 family)